MLGKCHTLHTKEAHKRYLMSKSLISRLAGQEEKMAQQLLLAGLALSSIWEKARARDRQREVARDKGQLGFVLQGMRPSVAQAAEWWQGAVLIRVEGEYPLVGLQIKKEKASLRKSFRKKPA
jgi:hypothetical protein